MREIMSFRWNGNQTVQEWLGNCFELVFQRLRSPDLTEQITALGQFEVLYHFTRSFGERPKQFNSPMFKLAFKLYPLVRHLFEIKHRAQYYLIIDEFERMRRL